ncbi:MAG: hypothetical protein ACRDVZ_13265 [Jiangellaceae bacterium]
MRKEITRAELDIETVELLPLRETLFWGGNFANVYASNSALAVNAATILSAATANATQVIIIGQS